MRGYLGNQGRNRPNNNKGPRHGGNRDRDGNRANGNGGGRVDDMMHEAEAFDADDAEIISPAELTQSRSSMNLTELKLKPIHDLVKLAEQALRWRPQIAVIQDETRLPALRERLNGSGIETAAGARAVIDAARADAQWVMSAIVGFAGLAPTLAAANTGAIVALANKESLICAGPHLLRRPIVGRFDEYGQWGRQVVSVSELLQLHRDLDRDRTEGNRPDRRRQADAIAVLRPGRRG